MYAKGTGEKKPRFSLGETRLYGLALSYHVTKKVVLVREPESKNNRRLVGAGHDVG